MKIIRIREEAEYLCIKSDMGFIKGSKYKSYLPQTLSDWDGDNMRISDEYFDEHFLELPLTPQ